MTRTPPPSRGEIWLVDLDPTVGREQQGSRPALVVSTDPFNHGPADLFLALPITSVRKGIPSHVPIARAGSGLARDSFAICEQVRCLSRARLLRRLGRAPGPVMDSVALYLRVLLEL